MLKVNKMSDYALNILYFMAYSTECEYLSAAQIAERVKLPQPVTAKILKTLLKHQIVTSRTGNIGGYRLASKPSEITLKSLLEIFTEYGVVECARKVDTSCVLEAACYTKNLWQQVNQQILQLLQSITLADIKQNTFAVNIEAIKKST